MTDPATQPSLILRLRDPADDDAWNEFLKIYEPMLFRLATRWGLQRSDAAEVVQETLLSVAKSISDYERHGHPGAFRGWLAAITRNRLADHLSQRRRQPLGSGDSDVQHWLDQQSHPGYSESQWEWQHKRQVFAWAAERVREQVAPRTWLAFELSELQGEPIEQVAEQLGMQVGMVYVARSRVMSRLRKSVQQWSEALPSQSPGGGS